MKNFSGILFTLKKREQNISVDDSKYYKYMILGSFDGLDVHTVDKWYELRPKGLLERNLQVDLNSPFIDQYTIRALVPSNAEQLEQKGFAYEFWKKAGKVKPESFENYAKHIRKKYPFICMSVLNFTEDFIRTQDNLQTMQEAVIQIILDCVKNAGYDLNKLHCAVFPSLGYSDFVILFLTDNLSKAANIINQIRGSVIHTNITVVSNCYSVCGLDKGYLTNGNTKLGENAQITIRINFKEGISAGDFWGLLNDELRKPLRLGADSEEFDSFIEEVKKNYYTTFGNADCLLLPIQPLERYLKWHGSGQILNPENPFFHKYIADVRTSVRINDDWNFEAESKHIHNAPNLSKYEEAFKEFIKKYDAFLEKNNMHIRNSRALQQVMKNFLNVAHASHGFDARNIIGKAFECLIENLNYCISLKKKRTSESLTEDRRQDNISYNRYIQDIQCEAVEAAETFKKYIGNFLSNLIRSDRPFIEGNVLTHSSIGSITKLLFTYSAILEKLTESFGEEKNFTFIVSSGGCDKTESIDLFSFMSEPVHLKKLIIIMVPEMSLYDIQGTLFRILHEYIHFIGNRMRRDRYRHLVNALASYFSWEICEFELNNIFADNVYEKAILHLTDDLQHKLKSLIDSEKTILKKDTRNKISAAISQHPAFVAYGKKEAEKDFYLGELREEIFYPETLIRIFSTNSENLQSEGPECLQKKLYDILYEKEKIFITYIYDTVNDLFQKETDGNKKQRLSMSKQMFSLFKQNYDFRDTYQDAYDMNIIQFIEHYLNSFFRNYSFNISRKKEIHARFSYTELVDNFMFPMVESFSDCYAIRMLQMSVDDFLLAFIYELWDMAKAFPMTVGNTLRLGSDLKVCYGIEHKLNDDVKTRIYEKAETRKKQGYKYHNVAEMIERIDILLSLYQLSEIEGIRTELEKYLTKCLSNSEAWRSQCLKELYEICDEGESGVDYNVIDSLICLWMNLGEGRKI